ncbi:MAG: ABC transporter permease subunit/CPBP intramembrane protease [Planctomycetota bacterium]|nr:ABC transporter permease subunit/CPBP intramembrane protease [Planctomycetota bacterium]
MSSHQFRGRLWRLCQKELRETLRDRRTIVTLLLMPLLVYPILSMALNRFLLASGKTVDGFTVCVTNEAEASRLDQWLSDPRSVPPQAILDASGGEMAKFQVTVIDAESSETFEEAVRSDEIDVGIQIDELDGPIPRVKFFAERGDANSQNARRILIERLEWLRLASVEFVLKRISPNYSEPLRIEVVDVGEVQSRDLLATIVPLVLVLMTITGAVYPAIDLTAGERERGTMESVMASPVPRGYILLAKYAAVVTVAFLTAIANLVAMFSTLWASGLLSLLTGESAFPFLAILQILTLLVLFSGFFSALLLSLTSFAKSFKEAQAYLIPVMLLSLTPAMLSLMPGATLQGAMAILPLINIVLLARDTLAGDVDAMGAMAAIASTIAYAAAALSIAARLFGSDAVTRTSEKSFGSMLRRPRQISEAASVQAATMMLAMLVPIYFLVSNGLIRFLQQIQDFAPIEVQLLFNGFALIMTFGLVPFAMAWLERNRIKTTFRIQLPHPTAWIGGLLLGLGSWAFAHEAFVIADALGIGGLSEEQVEKAKEAIDRMRTASPLVLLAAFALTPAVIEEFCFRGYLFSSLQRVVSPFRVIVITSLLFGLFHVLTGNTLLIERFIPSTLMGLIIGWVAYRTGSVLPGMLVHFIHNGLLNMVLYYQEKLDFLGAGFDNQAHLPPLWLGLATVLVLAGAGMMAFSKPPQPNLAIASS